MEKVCELFPFHHRQDLQLVKVLINVLSPKPPELQKLEKLIRKSERVEISPGLIWEKGT